LPKKGRLSVTDRERESAPEFVMARRQHSAVESASNALGVHGLELCRDHGLDGFKRYVALAVVAHNIQRLGAIVRNLAETKRGPYRKRPPVQLAKDQLLLQLVTSLLAALLASLGSSRF
jgi:hypothetical protein